MTNYVLEREQHIQRPLTEVFDFFADAENLGRLTPPSLTFTIETPRPIVMKPGTLIDYRIGLFGIPMRWKTRIEEWVPNERFVDVQLRGPYAYWHHLHTFETAPDGGTLIRDRVTYRPPLGPLGVLAKHLFVARQLDTIFDFRRKAVEEIFGASSAR